MSSEIFVVTDTRQLIAVNPQTLTSRLVGQSSVTMTDVAFAPDGNLYGISFSSLYKIDPKTGVDTFVGNLGLSGANAFEINAKGVAYIAANNSFSLYTLDLGTAQTHPVGSYSTSAASSGDLSFFGNKLYLTTSDEELVRLAPDSGEAISSLPLHIANMYGLETLDSTLYGFAGNLFYSVDPVTGKATAMKNIDGFGIFNGATSDDFSKPDTDGDTRVGGAKVDWLFGTSGNDKLFGKGAHDYLYGRQGNDALFGGAGDDYLEGGRGTDKLYGGSGSDTFFFRTFDSGDTAVTADTIYDFAKADKIDLRHWDANSKKAGMQHFDFIGNHAFSGHADELRFMKQRSDTWVQGDTDGDHKADFVIHLDDAVALKASHFDI